MSTNADMLGSFLILLLEATLVILIGLIGAAAGFFVMCILYVTWSWFTKAPMSNDLERRLFTIITRSGAVIAVALYVIFRTYLVITNP